MALTGLGLAFRLPHFADSLLGDELSTFYIVDGQSFLDVVRGVSTDAEISPPLYFAAAWLATQLGSAAELVRLPALIAGTASIPLAYVAGRLSLGNAAGLIAAAVMAINPFMVFYATDGRAYTLAIALLLGSTVAMLLAARSRRTVWWVAYALLTAASMYAHYSAAFVLGAQLLWLLWAHPECRRAAILANAGAALLFVPWIPSLLEDFDSPTIDILSALQGDGFEVKRAAVEAWAFGYPYNTLDEVPGRAAITIATIGFAVAAVAGLLRSYLTNRARAGGGRIPPVSAGMVLALALMLSTPVAELVLLGLGGSDLFGARNLNTASGGLALTTGGLLVAAGPWVGAVCGAAILGVFGFGAVKSLETDVATIDFRSAAQTIEENASGDDVVLDMASPILTPVPATPLDVYLPESQDHYRLYQPAGPPPYLDIPPPPAPIFERAIQDAEGGTLFLVAGEGALQTEGGRLFIDVPPPIAGVDESGAPTSSGSVERVLFPGGSKVVSRTVSAGRVPIVVYEIAVGGQTPG